MTIAFRAMRPSHERRLLRFAYITLPRASAEVSECVVVL